MLQHTAGTRSYLDFVETASTLMEYFLYDYRVLSLFAHHYKTGAVIPASYLAQIKKSKNQFRGSDIQGQISYSAMDNIFHSGPRTKSTTQIAEEVHNRYTTIPYSKNSNHANVTHFIGYGGAYYTYLHSHLHSANIWKYCFEPDPLSREVGERYRKFFLAPGGSLEPKIMLNNLLGTDQMNYNVLIDTFEPDTQHYKLK